MNTVLSNATKESNAFNAFVFALFGWAFAAVVGFQFGRGIQLHGLIAFVGLALAACAFRSLLALKAANMAPMPPVEQPGASPFFGTSDTAWCLLFLAVGCALSWSLVADSAAIFTLLAVGVSFVPWLKIAFCRKHYVVSCLLMLAGAVCSLASAKDTTDPLLLAFAAWACWIISCFKMLENACTRTHHSMVPTPPPTHVRPAADKEEARS